ncbi:hypothetical protein NDU88_005077 [Pleurodeles waltl]|uniref:Uncharacterized protein n=1 Tax=Pleurodeles waltl TaxID=8319 RepID=A0AAV7M8W6_PLEWA|nr:hypothetical protein NDU88_005077 [Pleurodeles waltl]
MKTWYSGKFFNNTNGLSGSRERFSLLRDRFYHCGALFPSRQPSEGACREGNQGNRNNGRGDALSAAHVFSPQSAARVFLLDARLFVYIVFFAWRATPCWFRN